MSNRFQTKTEVIKWSSQVPEEEALASGNLLRDWLEHPPGGEPKAIDSSEKPVVAAAATSGNSLNETPVRPNEENFVCPNLNSGLDTQARNDGTLEASETSALETPTNNHLSGQPATDDDVEKMVIEIFTFKKSFC